MIAVNSRVIHSTYRAQEQTIELTHKIARSGEGEVWHTNCPGQIAKIYHDFDERRSRKLALMVANPPKDPNQHLGHISFAWPSAILSNEVGCTVGFLMPLVEQSVDIMELYHPQRRKKVARDLTWMHLHVIAGSITSLVWAIHEAGYVLGDMKPQNILVNAKTHPSIIDTDSFQVSDPNTGELYRCQVGSESFTPPELIGQDLEQVTQTPLHDRFRLGLILYLLLFGEHPFKGQWIGSGDSPSPNDLVKQGHWPYGNDSLIQPGLLTIPLTVIHPALQTCFLRCFNQGHHNPDQRPTPQDWIKAFKLAIADLKQCRSNPHHVYRGKYGHCHWCDRSKSLGIDVFPAPESPQKILKQELDHLVRDIPNPMVQIRKQAERSKHPQPKSSQPRPANRQPLPPTPYPRPVATSSPPAIGVHTMWYVPPASNPVVQSPSPVSFWAKIQSLFQKQWTQSLLITICLLGLWILF